MLILMVNVYVINTAVANQSSIFVKIYLFYILLRFSLKIYTCYLFVISYW